MMFEGRVVAVYLNGTQVSTSLVTDYLENAYGQVDIKIKVAPSRYFFGTEEAMIVLGPVDKRDSQKGIDVIQDFFLGGSSDAWRFVGCGMGIDRVFAAA